MSFGRRRRRRRRRGRDLALGMGLLVALGLASSAVLLLPSFASPVGSLPQRSMLGLEHESDYEPDVEFMLMGGLPGPPDRSRLPASRSLLATPAGASNASGSPAGQPLTTTELLTLQHYTRHARRYLEVGCRGCG